jgi:preprotein translocase subunit SecD
LQLVLSWPVRILVLGLLLFSLIVDGAGYIYRVQNHYPLTGSVPGLPPNVFGWTLYIHKGLDIQGGTHLELQIVDVPKSIPISQAQTETIAVINKRVNALGVSEPYVAAEGSDRIVVELAGVPAAKAQDVIGKTARLVTTTWEKDPNPANSFSNPGQAISQGYRPKITGLTGDMVTSANASTDTQTGTQWVVNLSFDSRGQAIFGQLTTAAVAACPGTADCPERHIAEWLDLTQNDINHWDDPGYAEAISQPTSVPGGKLLTSPYILSEIPGGTATISCTF